MHKIKAILESQSINTTGFSKHSAVLIPLVAIDDTLHVIFEKRALHLSSQPGEICFPGGVVEKNETPLHAAVRETCEELNLREDQIEILGQMDSIGTNFDMLIHCFVAQIHAPYHSISPSPSEVDLIFSLPLTDILKTKPQEYTLQTEFKPSYDFPFEKIPDGKNYNFRKRHYDVLFYPFKTHMIWGLTAKMLFNFTSLLNDFEKQNNVVNQ